MDPLRTVLLVHILAGAVGLIAALPATRAAKRRGLHTRAGRVFALSGWSWPSAPSCWWSRDRRS